MRNIFSGFLCRSIRNIPSSKVGIGLNEGNPFFVLFFLYNRSINLQDRKLEQVEAAKQNAVSRLESSRDEQKPYTNSAKAGLILFSSAVLFSASSLIKNTGSTIAKKMVHRTPRVSDYHLSPQMSVNFLVRVNMFICKQVTLTKTEILRTVAIATLGTYTHSSRDTLLGYNVP